MGRHSIVFVLVSWVLLSSILRLPMSGAETASGHGQTRHCTFTCKLSLLSTWRMIGGTIRAAYINYGRYCVCRCLVQRLHPAMGRHGTVLVLVSWALLSTCSIIHAAYIELANTVPADVRCILLWHHNGRHGVSNHQPYECLLKCSFKHRSKKTPKLRIAGLCGGNSP